MAPHRPDPDVANVRAFNRTYAGVLGTLSRTYLDTPYNVQEARVIYEVATAPGVTAQEIRTLTDLDQGYLSRLIARLERAGVLRKSRSRSDGRVANLHLTAKGVQAFRSLDGRADAHVAQFLDDLGPGREAFLESTVRLQSILQRRRGRPQIREEQVGDVGWLFWRQAVVYAEEFGYSRVFERYVCEGLPTYVCAHDPTRDHLWIATIDGRAVGGVAVQHVDDRPGWAKLRWFLVEKEARGAGTGSRLLSTAIAFCAKVGYEGIFLWTVDDLDAARRLYQKAGFVLSEQHDEPCPWAEWGHEQRWELTLSSPSS